MSKIEIGIPRCLNIYSHLPFLRTFSSLLGFRTIISPPTNEEIVKLGVKNTGADFCFPVKIAYGHLLWLAERVNYILLPYFIAEEKDPNFTSSYLCIYHQGMASLAKTLFFSKGISKEKIVSPVLDFRFPKNKLIDELLKEFKRFGINKREIKDAFEVAVKRQKEKEKKCREEGKRILEEIKDEKAIVLMGRPYNILDTHSNLNIPLKISNLGYRVIPCDFLPLDEVELPPFFHNTFWHYAQKLLKAAFYIANTPNLYPVYFSNFACGPDSFLLSYIERIIGEKPLLILEFDEQAGDAGYMTRVEAFLDIIKKMDFREKEKIKLPKVTSVNFKEKRIWIPPLHPTGVHLFASVFRKYGYQAVVLDEEDEKSLEKGRELLRGSECLPCSLTLGNFVKKMMDLKSSFEKEALFMPTSQGPCRFGQYAVLHRLTLDKIGLEKVEILSPSSQNNYQGLEQKLRLELWDAIVIGDILYKIRNKLKPYEAETGSVEEKVNEAIKRLSDTIEKGKNLEKELKTVVQEFKKIKLLPLKKKLVGVVGEIYIRLDPYGNDYVVSKIEEFGGEAWVAPASEWFHYTSFCQRLRAKDYKNVKELVSSWLEEKFLSAKEEKWYKIAEDLIGDRKEPPIMDVLKEAQRYLSWYVGGESLLTIGRGILFMKNDGASLVVNVAPFTCMHGNMTTALFQQIRSEFGVPVVNMFYDGTKGLNEKLAYYIL